MYGRTSIVGRITGGMVAAMLVLFATTSAAAMSQRNYMEGADGSMQMKSMQMKSMQMKSMQMKAMEMKAMEMEEGGMQFERTSGLPNVGVRGYCMAKIGVLTDQMNELV